MNDGEGLMNSEQQKNEQEVNMIVFNELKRRVDITRRARIKASERLRERHEFFEKTSYFYSLVVLVLSVWFIDAGDCQYFCVNDFSTFQGRWPLLYSNRLVRSFDLDI